MNRAAERFRVGGRDQFQHDLPAFVRNFGGLDRQPFRESPGRNGQLRFEPVQTCHRDFDLIGFARLDGERVIGHNGLQPGHRLADAQSIEVVRSAAVQHVAHGGEICPILGRGPFQHRVGVYGVVFLRQFFAFGVLDFEPRIQRKAECSRLNP